MPPKHGSGKGGRKPPPTNAGSLDRRQSRGSSSNKASNDGNESIKGRSRPPRPLSHISESSEGQLGPASQNENGEQPPAKPAPQDSGGDYFGPWVEQENDSDEASSSSFEEDVGSGQDYISNERRQSKHNSTTSPKQSLKETKDFETSGGGTGAVSTPLSATSSSHETYIGSEEHYNNGSHPTHGRQSSQLGSPSSLRSQRTARKGPAPRFQHSTKASEDKKRGKTPLHACLTRTPTTYTPGSPTRQASAKSMRSTRGDNPTVPNEPPPVPKLLGPPKREVSTKSMISTRRDYPTVPDKPNQVPKLPKGLQPDTPVKQGKPPGLVGRQTNKGGSGAPPRPRGTDLSRLIRAKESAVPSIPEPSATNFPAQEKGSEENPSGQRRASEGTEGQPNEDPRTRLSQCSHRGSIPQESHQSLGTGPFEDHDKESSEAKEHQVDLDTSASQEDAQAARQRKEDIEQQYEALKTRVSSLDAENQNLKKQMHSLGQEKTTAAMSCDELKKDRDTVNSQLKHMQEQFDETRKLYEGTKNALQEKETHLSIAEKKIGEKKTENEQMRGVLENLEERLIGVSGSEGEVKQTIGKFQEDIAAIKGAIERNNKSINAYVGILESSQDDPADLVNLRTYLKGLLDMYGEMIMDLRKRNDILTKELSKHKKEHQELEEKHKSLEGQHLSQRARRLNNEDPATMDSFEKLYGDKDKAYKALEQKYTKAKSVLAQYYRPELVRENQELNRKYTALTDRHNLLREERKQWKTKARSWEDEHKALKERWDQHREGSEKKIEELEEEMRNVVTEYHATLPKEGDPDYSLVRALRQEMFRLERESIDRQEKIRSLRKQLQHTSDEFNRLRQAMEEGREIYYSDMGYPAMDSEAGKRRPKYESEEETASRLEIVKAFMEELKRTREKEGLEGKLVEKARKHGMGDHYPPDKKGYEKLAKMSGWDRWDVDEWLAVAASEADRDDAERIGRLGFNRSRHRR